MNDNIPPEDWLDEQDLHFDEAIDLPDPDSEFRARTLARTTTQVRYRRRTRYLARAAALLLAFASGIATTLAADLSLTPQAATQIAVALPAVPPAVTESSSPYDRSALTFTPDGTLDSEAISLRISRASQSERIDLLGKTGNYFLEAGNIQSAMNCYRQLLDEQPIDEFITNVHESNWLLASMVSVRMKESNHAESNG